MPWFACLLATMLVAGAMPVADAAPAPKYACAKSGDDQGMGGSHVTCYYDCPSGALLAIAVKASDPQSYSYGNTKCGGAEASCTEGAPACVGPSQTLTSSAQEGASCNGSSDEFWDSPVMVGCIATGADPVKELCRVYEPLCKDSVPGVPDPCENPKLTRHCNTEADPCSISAKLCTPPPPPCTESDCLPVGINVDELLTLCEPELSEKQEELLRDFVGVAGLPASILSLVVADFDGTSLTSVVFDGEECEGQEQ